MVQANAPISALLKNLDALEKVTELLDQETPGVKSWPQFAHEFGITEVKCNAIRPEGLGSPTKALLEYLVATNPKLTVKAFLVAIQKIERQTDVVKILQKFFDCKFF